MYRAVSIFLQLSREFPLNFPFFSTDLDLTLPGEVSSDQRAGTSAANPQGALMFRPANRMQNPVFIDPTVNRANFLLNTINEDQENDDQRFLNNSMTSSTPLQPRPPFEETQQSEEAQSPHNLSSINEESINETPKRSTEGRLSRRLSSGAEPITEEDIDEEDEEKENKNDAAPVVYKDCTVDLVKLRPSDGTMETFKENFVKEKQAEAEVAKATNDEQPTSSKSTKPSKITQRKPKVEDPIKSAERPKRKAREGISFKEASLGKKLRRPK